MSTFDPAGQQPPEPSQPYNPTPQPPIPGAQSLNLQDVSIAGWGLLGAAVLTFIASFLPWWSSKVSFGTFSLTASLSGWASFWWLGVLIGVAVGVLYALTTFKVIPGPAVTPLLLVYGALAAFVLTLISLGDTFAYGTSSGSGYSQGPSFGVFIALIATAALTYFGALAAQESGAKLPIAVPGPQRT